MNSNHLNRRKFITLSAASAVSAASIAAPGASASASTTQGPAPQFPRPIAKGTSSPIDFKSHLPASGTLPAKWICGSASCMDNTDPPVQIHWYNRHTAILRQNKAYAYEAPFMLLYFGNERILMVDQGDSTLRSDWPLRDVVDETIHTWCTRNGRKPESMQLLLAITHLHMDHFSAQNQFDDRPNTRIMGLSHAEMVGFWGMTDFPNQRVTLDLGGRELFIWGNPGHVLSEFAYYDTYTQILFTGDMFYRGRCYISLWDAWLDSMKRLVAFTKEHPVAHIVGCHVEMGVGGIDYPVGSTYQPNEAPWHLTVAELEHAYTVAQTIEAPGVYFTGDLYLCRLTGPYLTPDTNPYIYN
jgi:glyoxylase-like metal-dependent hydrolase (beta-lactamase superfamily II)